MFSDKQQSYVYPGIAVHEVDVLHIFISELNSNINTELDDKIFIPKKTFQQGYEWIL